MELLYKAFMLRTMEDSMHVCSVVEELVTITGGSQVTAYTLIVEHGSESLETAMLTLQ